MQKIRLFLALMCVASVLGFVSCGTEAETEIPRTVVTGQVLNRTADTPTAMLWFINDPFTDENISVELSEDGSFHMETQELSLLCNHTFKYGFINFFAAPGDSIHVVIDAKKMRTRDSDAVRFEGDRAEFNNEQLGGYNYMVDIIGSDLRNRLSRDMEPAAMVVQLNERLEKYQDSLAAYQKRQSMPLSDDLKDFIRRDNKFVLANIISDYNEGDNKIRLELFSDPFFELYDPKNFITTYFPAHLHYYWRTKMDSDPKVSAALVRSDYSTVLRNGIPILMREPASLARDAMMWGLLSHYIELRPSLYDSTPEIQEQELFTDARLNKKLEVFVKKLNNVDFPITPIEGVSYLESDGTEIKLPKGDVFAHLAQKYPNKVLYIDIYATWCGPCIDETKDYAPALHEAVKGKDVVFVNLCLDSSVQNWRKFVKQYNLSENYWFDENSVSIFRGAYNISGYPTYILVGKDGKIATMHAERPSHLKAAVEQIEELLAK